jgi:hypothetical protein
MNGSRLANMLRPARPILKRSVISNAVCSLGGIG